MDILAEALNFAKLMENADIEWAFVGGVRWVFMDS